ncbi:MAG: hypothetical protein HZA08_09630 [Nitrospirae bacterium]|nr:hypothetical protein [Nitrospirota bacterium]
MITGGGGSTFYVGKLSLSSGASLNLNGHDLFYNNLDDLGGTVYGGQLIHCPMVDTDFDSIPDCLDTDDDNDGLTDTWEAQYGLNPLDATGNNGADGDPDGDGFTNSAEFSGGSSPVDPASLPNHPPAANGGSDQNVLISSQVTLDGSASSDPDDDLITYNWTMTCLPSGSSSALSDSTIPKPVFIPDIVGTYCFNLTVCDHRVCNGADSVVISAVTPNVLPNASAGPDQNVLTGLAVLLNGSGSNDPDHGPNTLSYLWSFMSVPSGSVITNNDITGNNLPMASFVPDTDGDYNINLAVSDGTDTTHDQVIITADVSVPPVANAGLDQLIKLGVGVTVDGSGSYDQDGRPQPITYQWGFVSIPAGPSGSTLTNASIINSNTVRADFTPDVSGSYVLQIAVSDGQAVTTDNMVVVADGASPTGSISINNNAVWTKTTSVTLTISCDDGSGSGCVDMQISRDGIFDTELWESYVTSKAWTLATGNGNRWVYVRFRDLAGNISIRYSDSIKLDTTKPVVISVADTPDPFNPSTGGKTTFSFTVSDNLSVTCDVTVKIYNSANVLVKTINKTWAPCPTAGAASSVTWYGKNNSGVLVPAGTYTYKIQAKDKALNYSYIKSGIVTVQ